jgi:hypothetical protein
VWVFLFGLNNESLRLQTKVVGAGSDSLGKADQTSFASEVAIVCLSMNKRWREASRLKIESLDQLEFPKRVDGLSVTPSECLPLPFENNAFPSRVQLSGEGVKGYWSVDTE